MRKELFPTTENGPEEPEEKEDFFEKLPKADAVVVLGGQLKKNKDGKIVPNIESKMRALGALELLRNEVVKEIILSGGKMRFPHEGVEEMPDISISEAMLQYIKPYLKKYGISEESVVSENQSINTKENIENAIEILKSRGDKTFYLETSEYHLGRGLDILTGALEEEQGLKLIGSKTAEELLRKRSPHYEELVSYYEFPESLEKAPKQALIKGLKEFLRRALIYCDPKDKIATFLAEKIRRKE